MIHEIRETIQQTGSTTNGILQFQKRIEIRPGQRHTINHLDFFDDGLTGADQQTNDFAYQVYVSNYPIIMTDNTWLAGTQESGPLAGDDLVLFKAQMISYKFGSEPSVYLRQEFPNQFLSSMPTFNFYTPQLYFTVVFTDANSTDYTLSPAMSLYMAIESKEVDAVEYGIGMLQEYSRNQAMLLRNQGITISQADIIGAMPMWQIGGIRPEFMASNATNALGENWFFSTAGYGGSEAMSATAGVRAGLANARTMVDFGDAFGKASTTKAIPDWFKAIAKPFPGLESGPIRSQEPPLKHFDNGNVQML